MFHKAIVRITNGCLANLHLYPHSSFNNPAYSTPHYFLQLADSHSSLKHKKSGCENCCSNSPNSCKCLVLYTFSVRDINTTVATWLDCSRLMSDFSVRSREFIKACFCLKTHQFLPLSVLGNRSKTLLLPIICKPTDLPIASRLCSKRTSLKSHRLNSDVTKTHIQCPVLSPIHFPVSRLTNSSSLMSE